MAGNKDTRLREHFLIWVSLFPAILGEQRAPSNTSVARIAGCSRTSYVTDD